MESATTMMSNTLPVRLTSTVVQGFGRGSKELGIPTANLCRDNLQCKVSFEALPCGIYWGFARIVAAQKENGGDEAKDSHSSNELSGVDRVYKTAVSIGYNPVYGNKEKTIEPHLIASPEHPLRKFSKCGETQFNDFYGNEIRLSVVGYIRPELPFDGLEKLIDAIKNDIVSTERSADSMDESTVAEKLWVESNETP
jgi:riboflavin kinase